MEQSATLSGAVDALAEVVSLKKQEYAALQEHCEFLEDANSEQAAELHRSAFEAARTIVELREQLRLKDEQLEQLKKDYDKGVEILRETVRRQAMDLAIDGEVRDEG
jgi:DNA anti-recombination protein RmuC